VSENFSEETLEIYDKIISKYGMNQFHEIPSSEGESFKIVRIDDDDKIVIKKAKTNDLYGPSQEESYTLEEFESFLHNYKLFENKIIKLLRQLNEQDKVNKDQQLVIDFLGKLPDVKPKSSIEFLKQEVEDYNNSTGSNLDLKTVLRLSDNPKPNFPFKIDLFGLWDGEKQRVISTYSYEINPKVKFTLTHNPIWNKNLPGVNINL